MAWFLVDDELSGNPKILKLLATPNGFQALGLWTLCGSWSRKYRTHGAVSAAAADASARKSGQNADASALAAALVEAELWEATADGFQFVNWEDVYTAEDKAAKRKEKDRKRKKEKRRGQAADKVVDESADIPRSVGRTPGSSPSPSPSPSLATQEGESAPARASAPPHEDPPDRDPGEPEASLADRVSLLALVRIRVTQWYDNHGGAPPWTKSNMDHLRSLAVWLEPKGHTGAEYEKLLATILAHFFADERQKGMGYPLGFLVSDAAKFLKPQPGIAQARRRSSSEDFAPPAPAERFTNVERDVDEVLGITKGARGV